MQIIFYSMIYIIGVLLGSFFTLAIYRIPRNQDITHTNSYCPSCKHNLNFLDLIPILSYIFLGGKCRYCKQKIGPRYIIIETISGIFYLFFILSFKLNIMFLDINQIIFLVLISIFYSIIIIFAGIEKETKEIPNKLIVFSFIYEIAYIIYLYMLNINIYRYIIYLIIALILLLILRKKEMYIIKVIYVSMFSLLFITNNIAIIVLMINVIINILLKYMKKEKILPVYNICITNLLALILLNFIG